MRVSVRDFHRFRVTWITLALAAGVPLELVQRVTGHKTVEIVLKHYFRPGREDFKQRILAAMPKLLAEPIDGAQGEPAGVKTIGVQAEEPRKYGEGEGPSETLEAAIEALKGVTGKANQDVVSKAVDLIEKAKGWYDGHIVREPEVGRA